MKKLAPALLAAVLVAFVAQPADAAPTYKVIASSKFSKDAKTTEIKELYGDKFWSIDDVQYGGFWSSDRVSVHDGYLDLKGSGGKAGYAAFDPSGKGITYGRFEYSIKVTGGKGYKFAGLLWPSSDEWSEGELDFPEGHTDKTINVYHHSMECTYDNGVEDCPNDVIKRTKTKFNDGKWHHVKVEWTPTSVKYYLDSKRLVTVKTNVPTTPHRMTLQVEPRGSGKRETTHVKIGSYKISSYTP